MLDANDILPSSKKGGNIVGAAVTIAPNELVFLAQLITLLPAFFLHSVERFCNVLTLAAEITTYLSDRSDPCKSTEQRSYQG